MKSLTLLSLFFCLNSFSADFLCAPKEEVPVKAIEPFVIERLDEWEAGQASLKGIDASQQEVRIEKGMIIIDFHNGCDNYFSIAFALNELQFLLKKLIFQAPGTLTYSFPTEERESEQDFEKGLVAITCLKLGKN